MTQTSLPLFFTRWITHFCAPTFVFLAGVGAGLSAARGKPRGALARFLLTRGVWLIIAEFTVIRFGWTFNFDYANQLWVQVIWALGWSMIVLAGLIYLPTWFIAAFGLVMIGTHNLLDGIGLDVGLVRPSSAPAFATGYGPSCMCSACRSSIRSFPGSA